MRKILIIAIALFSIIMLSATTFKTDRVLVKSFTFDAKDSSAADSIYFKTDILNMSDAVMVYYLMEFESLDSTSFYGDTLELSWLIKSGYTSPNKWYISDYHSWDERDTLFSNLNPTATTGKTFITDPISPLQTGTIIIDGYIKNEGLGERDLKMNLWRIKIK